MNIRKIALAVATIATLSPVISNASPERNSVKACASAFATSIAASGAGTPAYKVDYRGGPGDTLADFYATDYTFTLEARNPKTGVAIARAVCSTDSRGTVTAISAVPLNAQPTLARQ
jgi:hypothetical protein